MTPCPCSRTWSTIVREIVIRSSGSAALAPADGLGDELARLVLEQDRPAVGADRLEDELEDLRQERVDVEDVADRLGGPVHDREVDQPVLEPAAGDVRGLEDARALARRDAPEDRRAVVGAALASMSTRAVRSRSAAAVPLVEEHHRLAELEPVARAAAAPGRRAGR